MLAQLYLFAYILFTLGSLLMIFDLAQYAWYTHFVIPRKANGRIVLDERDRERSKNITLLVPAYKETEVIEETIESIANLNYYPGKFHALFILDEKEELEKERDSAIVLPTALSILDGRYSEQQLLQLLRSVRPDLKGLKEKYYRKWVDHYRHKAEILAIATLDKFNNPRNNEALIPIAFAQLRGQEINDEEIGNDPRGSIVEGQELIAKEQGGREKRERYLSELYEKHPAFETTIGIVTRLKGRYEEMGKDVVAITVVPPNYDGSYRHPQMRPEAVQSSKGRALNWGLNEVEKLFPETDIIGIYDSDARPHEDVLAYINQEMLKSGSKYVFYQGPIYLVRNFHNVPWVCKQSGLQGTCWHRILYPIYIFKHQNDVIHFSGTNYFYTIDAIRQTDGYPPFHPTEDLGLAYDVYTLRLEGKLPELRIVPHPYEELEQTTQGWGAWFKQQYRWASGGPYQLRKLLQNNKVPRREKARMVTRLMSPFPLSVYALFLGMTGLALTAISILGLAIYPELAPEMVEAMKYIMLMGFSIFLATPVAIYLWSIDRNYMRAKGPDQLVLNVLAILVTTIPYFIIATVPVIQAWTNPLRGWGSKTPRTEERSGLVEEEYLQASRRMSKKP
ncbi:MAG: glycosyltransferase family 2 protein [Methanomassiliicoccus sp.]|nr:glycosyltransferase family 2 protein [Methanomassiliicoccus sp.]